jgi:hypothetical protein
MKHPLWRSRVCLPIPCLPSRVSIHGACRIGDVPCVMLGLLVEVEHYRGLCPMRLVYRDSALAPECALGCIVLFSGAATLSGFMLRVHIVTHSNV